MGKRRVDCSVGGLVAKLECSMAAELVGWMVALLENKSAGSSDMMTVGK